MSRLFGTWDAYRANMREVLERRLNQLSRIDDRLLRLVQRAVEDIPDYPDDCLNNLTNIQELALDVIWQQELGSTRTLPQEWWDQWSWWDSRNGTVTKLTDYAGRRIPGERALQCGMLELVTGSRARFDPIGRFATKDMYVLVSAIHNFRNRVQHADGEAMDTGVAIAGLMLCIELLACIDRRLAETAVND